MGKKEPRLDSAATEGVAQSYYTALETAPPFAAARSVAARLGAHPEGPGRGTFGFWTPELVEEQVGPDQVFLELLFPPENIDLSLPEQEITFERHLVPTIRRGEFTWAVVDGVEAGDREKVGCFYSLVVGKKVENRRILDPLAYSVPFGAGAPAELYDFRGVLSQREDKRYFDSLETAPDDDGVERVLGPSNMLEIHVATASEGGTLADLTERYRRIGEKLRGGVKLAPGESSFVGYDAVQLMPVEPTILYEAGPSFWEEDTPGEEELRVTCRRPNTSNWGYDVITVASPAPNPTLLASGRPQELLDLIATLHTLPGTPIKVVFDIVYGHADNQSLPLLNRHYFAGPNMYGQNLNYQHPVVRAVLLEMQWRKSQYGVDGIRVDGAQDFKYWVAKEDRLYHDDEYLRLMNNLEQEVAGRRYRPWMVFEDGRPWPRDDWELASSYREVTKLMPNVVQWGPLTFAHNTPFLFTFWISKWWRLEQLTKYGSHWITGTSNHDTLRRGTQVAPEALINTYLGPTLPQIFKEAYDNPNGRLFDLVMPGIPMDFLNANSRAPWSFFRNSDDRYGVKVVSEEARFLDWAVEPDRYEEPADFARVKKWGFPTRDSLRRFMVALEGAVKSTDYDLPVMAALLNSYEPPLTEEVRFTPALLKRFARDWMDDVLDYSRVPQYEEELDEQRSDFNLRLRQFGQQRPWLVADLQEGEHFGRIVPEEGSILFYALRREPGEGEELLYVGNMEGAPRRVTPVDLPVPGLAATGWEVALAVPGLESPEAESALRLANGEGVLFSRRRS